MLEGGTLLLEPVDFVAAGSISRWWYAITSTDNSHSQLHAGETSTDCVEFAWLLHLKVRDRLQPPKLLESSVSCCETCELPQEIAVSWGGICWLIKRNSDGVSKSAGLCAGPGTDAATGTDLR